MWNCACDTKKVISHLVDTLRCCGGLFFPPFFYIPPPLCGVTSHKRSSICHNTPLKRLPWWGKVSPNYMLQRGRGKCFAMCIFPFRTSCSPLIGIQPSLDVLIQNSTSHGGRREQGSGCLCGPWSELLPAHFCPLQWSLCRLRAADAAWLSPFCVSSVHSVAQNFVFVCHFFFPLLFFFFFCSLCCPTLHSHQSCCCLWIAILLWSKAGLAGAQQACLWFLAMMLTDLNVPA